MNNEEAPCRVGIVGCGDISAEYVDNLRGSPDVTVVACADLDEERARRAAKHWGIAAATVPALLGDPAVDLILNLTPPRAHAQVSREAILAGKHVYSEKPLATDVGQARTLVELARDHGRRLACAPDTFLSPAYATAATLIRRGEIGEIVAISMAGLYGPPETWHPNPRFLYAPGAGPLFDMGPYFLHALFFLAGPVSRVRAVGRIAVPNRRIGSGPMADTEFQASTPTYVSAILELRSGPLATLQISFDVCATTAPFFEIQGTAGTLVLPDPEDPHGTLRLFRDGDWRVVEPPAGRHRRGTGVLELVRSARERRLPALPVEYGLHAVDVMQSILQSVDRTEAVTLTSTLPSEAAAGRPD